MLVLTRRRGERIIIGGNIEVVLLDTEQGRARIGVLAPKAVTVHRSEIQQKVDAQAALSAKGGAK